MLFFLHHGYRVIAHDRRGHGRSAQVSDGHDMDHYADDLAALTAHLDLKNAIHVGHSSGGGEVVHYLGRHGEGRVAKAVLVSAVPPLMMKTTANPGGLPKEVFDGLQAELAANHSQFYRDLAAGPFYGFNRPGVKPSEAIIHNWWRQGMMGGAKAHYDGIVAFSQADFTDDLKKITVPVLVMHGDDDQIVPYADSDEQLPRLTIFAIASLALLGVFIVLYCFSSRSRSPPWSSCAVPSLWSECPLRPQPHLTLNG
jgi:non-heme chloroperoxidase